MCLQEVYVFPGSLLKARLGISPLICIDTLLEHCSFLMSSLALKQSSLLLVFHL